MEQNHGRPNQAELLQNFQRLDELDTEFRGLANDIMAVFMRPDLTPDDVIMTGSAAEGCLLARWFREGKAIFEVDLLFAGISLTQDHFEKNIEELPRKPGFVKILYDKTIADSFHPKLRSDIIAIQNSIESPYLCGGRIKRDMTLRRIRYQDEEGAVKLIVSMFLGVPMTSISVDDKSDVDGPSANVYVNVKTPTGHFLEYSSDNVPAARCDFWPPLAKEWISRQRRWPSDDVITGIVQKGCHLVAKSTVGGDEDFEWRWSFSIAEKELALRRNPHQRLCYLMFKSIFYARMKFEINSKTLPSYLVKTVMMRMCEQLPPSEWSGDTLVARLTDLFVELERCFRQGELLHYFIPQINLLADVEDALQSRALVVLQEVLPDPLARLPSEVGSVCALAEYLVGVLRNVKAVSSGLTGQLVSGLIAVASMKGLLPKSTDIDLD